MSQHNTLDACVCAGANPIESALEAGAALAEPAAPKGGPHGEYLVVPEGHKVERLDALLERPRATRQSVNLTELASFIAYVTRFKVAGQTVIYAAEKALRFTAVIDHPTPETTAWGQHRATLALTPTREWLAWTQVNGKKHDQVSFAEFIESHIPEIAQPDGAALLEMVKQLDIRKAVAFESSIRLDNGQVQLTYVENVSGAQAKSTATIPETFVLGLAPFEGSALYKVTARLRYRLAEGRVALWFELLRPEDVLRQAWKDAATAVLDGTALLVLAGEPPALA